MCLILDEKGLKLIIEVVIYIFFIIIQDYILEILNVQMVSGNK